MSLNHRPLVAGNWKLYGTSENLPELTSIASGLRAFRDHIDTVICTPATLIQSATIAVGNFDLPLGGQDCSVEAAGAFTGDVSAAMLADAGAKYVILGHSERRLSRHEVDAAVRLKIARATEKGLIPIVCVGESESEMLAGQTEEVLTRQLKESLPDTIDKDGVVVAYEPVWAIGTGRTPTVDRISEIHRCIKRELANRFGAVGATVRVLYGGSVKPENSLEIARIDGVDGALVGGASLKAVDFVEIARSFADRHR